MSRLASLTARTASPPPSAIAGASGPTTAPKARLATAATKMPGSSAGSATPPGLKPSAGEWPPRPGMYLMTAPTIAPATASGSSGHQGGAPWKPKVLGQVGEHPRLDVGDQLEQPVDQERDHHAQDRRQDQQGHILLVRKTAKGSFGVV